MTGTRPPRSSPLAASRSRGPDRFSPLPSTIDPVSWDTTAEDCPRRASRSLRSTSPTGTAARPSSSLRSTTSRPRQERSQQQEEGGHPTVTPLPGVKSLGSARGPIIAGPCGPKIKSQGRGREVQDRACGVVVQVDRLAILDENAEEAKN